jgi:large subunit ribosomal protein L15
MAKKKKQKKRGSREHGRGKKAGRGAGMRGGRGNANPNGSRKLTTFKEKGTDYFGGHGFNRPPEVVEETVTMNVGDLLDEVDNLAEEGHVDDGGDVTTVDLEVAGIDKLLGAGRVFKTYEVRVPQTTDKARDKIEANGGSIEVTEPEDEEDASDEAESSND